MNTNPAASPATSPCRSSRQASSAAPPSAWPARPTRPTTDVQRPDIVATPNVKAHPAPEAMPGWRWHHGIYQVENLQPGYTR